MASRGGKIYLACRDKKRAEDAIEKIKQRSGSENVHFLQLDLSSLESIREFSRNFHQFENRLDILINNAGIFDIPKTLTKDGLEMQMGVNHLGHFHLTNLLLDLLKASAPSRIINVASEFYIVGNIERDNFMSENSYGQWKAYANSKLANILHVVALSKRLQGTGVTANALHPGGVRTEIHRDTNWFKFIMLYLVFLPMIKTPKEGSQTTITLALDPDLEKISGKYFNNCKEEKVKEKATDEDTADWLWNKSIELTDK